MEEDIEVTSGTQNESTAVERDEDSAMNSPQPDTVVTEDQSKVETELSDVGDGKEGVSEPSANAEEQVEIAHSDDNGVLNALKFENERLKDQLRMLETKINDIENENKKLFEVSERSMEVPRKLEIAIKKTDEELTELKASKISVDVRIEELRAREISLKHRENMLEEESEELLERISKLSSEFEVSESKWLKSNSLLLQQVAQLQADLDTKTKQLKLEGDDKIGLISENQKLQAYCKELNTKFKSSMDECATTELTLRETLNNQNTIIELFQDKVKDFDAKTKDLEEAVSELQNLHKSALEDCSKLEQDSNLKNRQHQQEIEKRDITIREMAIEIEELKSMVNTLGNQDITFEGVALRSPSAAATYRSSNYLAQLLRIDCPSMPDFPRLKASDITSANKTAAVLQEYRKRICTLERENHALKSRVSHKIASPNQKTGAVEADKKIREESTEALKKLAEDKRENYEYLEELQVHQTRLDTLTRENDRLKIKNTYLGRQVSYLTREVELSRFEQKPSQETSMENIDLLTGADGVITQKLVPFRSIEELQKRNIELLAIVRELADIKDTDSMATDELIIMRNAEVTGLKSEIDYLKSLNQQHEQSLRDLEEELDSYKQTSEKDGEDNFSSLRFPTSTPLPRFSKEDKQVSSSQKLEMRLMKAESEVKFYKENLTKEKEAGREKLSQVVSQLETARKEALDVKAQLLRTQSLEVHHKENTKLVKINYENKCKELNKLKENFSALKDSNIQLEEAKRFLKASIAEHQAIEEMQVSRIERLAENESILKKNISRLNADLQNFKTSSKCYKTVEDSLKQIQTQILRSEDEQIKNLQARNDTLVNELALMWKRLKQEEERQKSTVIAWESANSNLRNEVEEMKEKNLSLSLSLDEATASLQEFRNRALNANQPSSSMENLEDQNRVLEAKNSSLNHLLSVEKEANLRLTELSKITELKLLESNSDRRLLQERWDAERAKYLFDLQSSEARLAVLMNENQELSQKARNLESRSDPSDIYLAQLAECQAEVTRLEVELKIIEDHKASLEEKLKKGKENFKEVERRFEEESISHSETMAQLIEVQKNELKLKGETFEYKLKVKNSEERLRESQNEAEVAKAENDLIRKHNLILQTENETLLKKHDELSEHISTLTNNGAQQNVSVSGDESQIQLMEIVKHLRKEKDILLQRLEALEAESVRIKAELLTSKTDTSCIQDMIGREMLPSSEYAKLLENVEAIPALKENNQVLRKENEELKQKVAEIQRQLVEEKGHNEPLKLSLKNSNEREDTLKIELDIQRAESLRWRQRAHQLIEKDHRVDPEELKRLESENSELSMANKQLTAQLKQHSLNLMLSEKNLCSSVNELASFKKSKESELNRVSQEASKAKAECRLLSEKLSDFQSKNFKNELFLKEAEAEKVRLSSEIEKLIVEKQTIDTLKKEIEEFRANIQNKDEQIKAKEVLIAKLRSSAKSLRDTCGTLRTEKTSTEEKLREYQEGAAILQESLDKTKNDTTVADLTARVSELDSNMKSREEDIKKYCQNIENLEMKIKELSHVSDNYERLKEDKDKLMLEIDNLKSLIASAVKSEKDSVEKMEKLRKEKAQLETDHETLKSQHKKIMEDNESDKARLLQTIKNLEQGSLEKGERPPQETVTASVKPVISATSQATQRKSTSVQPQAHIQPTRHAPSQTATMFVRSASIGRGQGQGEPNQPQVNVVGPIVSNYSLQIHPAESRETFQDDLPRALVQPRQSSDEAIPGPSRPHELPVVTGTTPQLSSQIQPSTSRGQVVLPTPKRAREQHDVGEEMDDTSKKARLSADSQVQEPSVTIELEEGDITPLDPVQQVAMSHFEENVEELEVEFGEDHVVEEENVDRDQADPSSEMIISVEEAPDTFQDLNIESDFQVRDENVEESHEANQDLSQYEASQFEGVEYSSTNEATLPPQDAGLESFGLEEDLNEGSLEQVSESVDQELARPESSNSTTRDQSSGSRTSRNRIIWSEENQ